MRYISVALAALALLLSYPARTQAYCLNMVKGKSLAWKTMPVSYRVSGNLKDAAVLAAIHKAFATWGSVGCSELAFKKAGTFSLCSDAACLAFGKTKGTIDVYWFTGKSDLFKNTSNPGSPYATFAHPIYDKASAIVGASIGVNAFDFKWKTTGAGGFLDVQNEMTALVGGVIGLADSGIKGTTMSGKITYGETAKRTLEGRFEQVRLQVEAKGAEVQQLQEDLEAQRPMLSAEALREKESEYQAAAIHQSWGTP